MTATPYPPVAELVPHAPPSLLLDELLHADDQRALARVTITEQSAFYANRGVPAVVALEYMSQTIAAFSGFQRRRRGLPVQRGLLVGCRLMTLDVDAFLPGDELHIEARPVGSSEALRQFECDVSRDGRSLARAVLNVFEGSTERGRQP
jgi:predicted hotdog family 3-hydroxylacyl-ACP dehydratase